MQNAIGIGIIEFFLAYLGKTALSSSGCRFYRLQIIRWEISLCTVNDVFDIISFYWNVFVQKDMCWHGIRIK